MKSVGKKIKEFLIYDKELVDLTREIKISKEELYNHLINGKITMTEYISLV
ncbi:MAG TPA: hypothetical protein VIM07_01860 [Chitinophagaceae bacterium]